MKRLIILVLLVGVAAIAGMFRSHSSSLGHQLMAAVSDFQESDAREEIRKTVELSPGANVEVSGINGAVTIETSTSSTAEVYIERTAENRDALSRRQVIVEASPTSLKIRGEKYEGGLISKVFGSNAKERVTLKLPRQVSLTTRGVNGSVKVGDIDGVVNVHGINGKVEIGQAGTAGEFNGINGNISVSLREVGKDGVKLSGINGNIELRLNDGVKADFEAHGMNGRVISEIQDVVVENQKRGRYSAQVGGGGNPILAHGINGNIRLTRPASKS